MTDLTFNPGWTPDRIAELKRLYGHVSSSEVAKALGWVSRHSVIGKAYRLGLSGERPPPKDVVRIHAPKAPRAVAGKTVAERAPERLQIPPGLKKPPKPLPVLRVVQVRLKPKPIDELLKYDCKWPVNDGEHPTHGFLFCAAPRDSGEVYCCAHKLLSVKPGKFSFAPATADRRRFNGRNFGGVPTRRAAE